MRGPSQACVTPQLGLCPPKAGLCPWLMDMEPPSLSTFPLQDREQLRVVLRLEGGSLFPTRSLPTPPTSFPVMSAPYFYLQIRMETRENNFPPRPFQAGCGVVPVPSYAVLAALYLLYPVDYFSPF